MIRRVFAILLALCVLFSAVLCFADGMEEFDDEDWDDDDFFEDESYEAEEILEGFNAIASYGIEKFRVGDFEFTTTGDGNGAVLTSYKGSDPDVVIPETAQDLPVVDIIEGACLGNPVIESIEIPGTVLTVRNNAFASCEKLKTVKLGEGVLSLGKCCFGGCRDLVEVQFPDSLKFIDDYAFASCTGLEQITFGAELETIGMQAFLGCAKLGSVTMTGNGEVQIGKSAFDGCAENPDAIIR